MIKHFLLAALLCLSAGTAMSQVAVTVQCPNCQHSFNVTISGVKIVNDGDNNGGTQTVGNGTGNSGGSNTGSTANLTTEEMAVVNEINFARTEPQRYVKEVLEPFLQQFDNSGMSYYRDGVRIITNEGVSAVREAIQVLNSATPLQPLSVGDALTQAAKFHTADIGPKGMVAHNSSDGTAMWDRIKKFMPNCGLTGECVSYGFDTGRDIVRQLIVDDGVSSRGHRNIIMSNKYAQIGVGIGQHTQYKYMCTVDFSSSSL